MRQEGVCRDGRRDRLIPSAEAADGFPIQVGARSISGAAFHQSLFLASLPLLEVGRGDRRGTIAGGVNLWRLFLR